MGYYTKYDLVVHPEQSIERETEIMRAIAAKVYEVQPAAIADDEACWCFEESLKWYDHTNDMIEISKQFPNITFILDGEGEERSDIWREYYCNGEWEGVDAEIIFPEPLNPLFKNL